MTADFRAKSSIFYFTNCTAVHKHFPFPQTNHNLLPRSAPVYGVVPRKDGNGKQIFTNSLLFNCIAQVNNTQHDPCGKKHAPFESEPAYILISLLATEKALYSVSVRKCEGFDTIDDAYLSDVVARNHDQTKALNMREGAALGNPRHACHFLNSVVSIFLFTSKVIYKVKTRNQAMLKL